MGREPRRGCPRAEESGRGSPGALKDIQSRSVPFSAIVNPSDQEKYINIPPYEESEVGNALDRMLSLLKDIGIQASTGAVVDFRAKDELRMKYEEGAVPLLYPVHFKDGRVRPTLQGPCDRSQKCR